MKKILATATAIVIALTVILSNISFASDYYTGQTIFLDETQENYHKKIISELEFTNAVELEYFDYFSERIKREVAIVKYKFYEEDLTLLNDFMKKSGKNGTFKNSNYLLTIQYITGLGISYEIEEVKRNFMERPAES